MIMIIMTIINIFTIFIIITIIIVTNNYCSLKSIIIVLLPGRPEWTWIPSQVRHDTSGPGGRQHHRSPPDSSQTGTDESSGNQCLAAPAPGSVDVFGGPSPAKHVFFCSLCMPAYHMLYWSGAWWRGEHINFPSNRPVKNVEVWIWISVRARNFKLLYEYFLEFVIMGFLGVPPFLPLLY